MPLRLWNRVCSRNLQCFLLLYTFCFDIVGASVTLFNVANFSVEIPILGIDQPLRTATNNGTSNNVTYYSCDFPRYSGSYDEDLVLLDIPLKDTSSCFLDVEKLNANAQSSYTGPLARGFGLLVNWNAPKLRGCRRYAELMTQITDYSKSTILSPFQLRAALFTAVQASRTDIGFPYVTFYGDLSSLIPGPVYYGLIAADDGAELSKRLSGQKVNSVLVRLTSETGMWNFLTTTSSCYFWVQSICLFTLVVAAFYSIHQLFLIFRDANRYHWKARSGVHAAGLGYAIVSSFPLALVPLNLLDAQVGMAFYWTSTYFQFSAYNGLLFSWNLVASDVQEHNEFPIRIFKQFCFLCHVLFILMTICLIVGPDINDFTLVRVGFNIIFILMPTIFSIQALMFGYLAYTLARGCRLNQLSESTRIAMRKIIILSLVSSTGNILLTFSAILDGLWATLTVPGYIAQMAVRQIAYVVLFGVVFTGQKIGVDTRDGERKTVECRGWKRLWSMSKRVTPNHKETKTGMFPDGNRSLPKSKWSVIIDGDTTTYLESCGAKVTEFGPGRISIVSPISIVSQNLESECRKSTDTSSSCTMVSGRYGDHKLDRTGKGNNSRNFRGSIRMSSRSMPEMKEGDPSDSCFEETDDPPMLPDDINEGGSLSKLAKSLAKPPRASCKRTRIRPPIPAPFLDQVHGAREDAFEGLFDHSENLFLRNSTMAIQIPSLKCLNYSADQPVLPRDFVSRKSSRTPDRGTSGSLSPTSTCVLSHGNEESSTKI